MSNANIELIQRIRSAMTMHQVCVGHGIATNADSLYRLLPDALAALTEESNA